jgi:ElaB/YqjD/DUF883 family membrane-anchored ribosome-binding protein
MNAGTETPSSSPTSPQADLRNPKTRHTDATLTEQAAATARTTVDRVAEKAAKAEEQIREVAAAGEERLREKGAEARIATERAMDHVRQYAQDNPLAAAGIAFAAGLVLSRLLSR